MGKLRTIARRTFLLGATAVAGGVAVGYYFHQREPENPLKKTLAEGEVTFSQWLKIGSDGSIIVYTGQAEMGQGISTTLAALVAEELDVALDQIQVEHGPASSAYRNNAILDEGGTARPWDDSLSARIEKGTFSAIGEIMGMQMTGGSTSTIDRYEKMRAAGAAAREMLKAAAAERLGVSPLRLTTENGTVISGETRIPYGDLAAAAAAIEPPADIALRDPKDWRLLGKSQPRTDMRAKVTGAPIFGIDVDLPGMVHATVRMAPSIGSVVASYDDTAARAVPGVEKIVRLDTHLGNGFGVIASNTWAAFKGAEAIDVTWGPALYPGTVDEIMADYRKKLEEPGASFRSVGDAPAALAAAPADQVLEADYTAPFLAHACLEPMNATAQFKDGKLTVWAPNQSPTLVALTSAAATGVDRSDVEVITTHLGGGFGRRAEPDFSRYAALLAMETDGRPVKVTWTREEDQGHDAYRPAAIGRFRAVIKQGELPEVFFAKVSSPSIQQSLMGRLLFSPSSPSPDKVAVDGIFNQPVDFAHVEVEAVHPDQTLPIGFWRAVGNSFNGYFHEGFMDEIAHASGLDPVEMRLKLMANYPPAQKVVAKAADMAGWGRTLAPGKGLGFASTYSFGTHVAQAIEVTSTQEGIRIDKVWCAADPGRVLDPAIFSAQLSSGIIFGLSSAMGQKITLKDGAVQELNFWDYDSMRLAQCPAIEVSLLENAEHMGGAGEPGTPPSIPALGNAIFSATGQRLRALPFSDTVDFIT